jgi:AraC-like DNA-binding protein
MSVTKSYSTARVAPCARLRYWNDLHADLLAPLEIKARERRDFDAAACTADLGPLRFVRVDSAPATVEHRARHVARTRERRFRLVLPVKGQLDVRHGGHESMLGEGDFALLDDSVPYRMEFGEPNRSLCVSVAPDTIKAYLPTPAHVCGLRMPASRPLNKVASTMLLALWAEIENEDLRPEQRPALARSFLQVLAASYALDHTSVVERSVVVAARQTEVKQYIEAHLRSPDLTPTTIAAALGFSRRYLRLLFAAEDDSVTAYIRRRRLEECAFELAQLQWVGRSITATAADWGFRSVTHFTRAFKTAYGTTPRAFKQSHQSRTEGCPPSSSRASTARGESRVRFPDRSSAPLP